MNSQPLLAFADLDAFFSSPAGLRLSQEIVMELKSTSMLPSHLHGLQLGACGENIWQSVFKQDNFQVVSPQVAASTTVCAYPEELPFAKGSFDLVFVPYLWELVDIDPNALVYEVDRVLSSGGYLIILGFNPSSLWKLSRFFSFGANLTWFQQTPGYSFWKLRRMYSQLGYQQVQANFFYYIPPVQAEFWLHTFDWIHRFSKWIAFYPPSCFLLLMKKQEPAWVQPVLVKNLS